MRRIAIILVAAVLLIAAGYLYLPSVALRLYSPSEPKRVTINIRHGESVEIHGSNVNFIVQILDVDEGGPDVFVMRKGENGDFAEETISPGERGQPFSVSYFGEKNGIHTLLEHPDGEGIPLWKSVGPIGAITTYGRGAIVWTEVKTKPNHLPEPTLASGTSPAGQEPRHR
jgi:hypothetical protein